MQLAVNREMIVESQVTEVSTVGSLLPGHQVSALITSVDGAGLNVQVCGFFEGTLDLAHLDLQGEDIDDVFKVGKKVRHKEWPAISSRMLMRIRLLLGSSTTILQPHRADLVCLLYHMCSLSPALDYQAVRSLSRKQLRLVKHSHRSRSRGFYQTGESCAAQPMVCEASLT